MRKVYTYLDKNEAPVLEYIKKSNPKIKKKFEYMLGLLQDNKNILCEPHIKHFTIEKYKMLYELRLRAAGMMVHIIYFMDNDDFVLVHAFNKRNKRDTEKALEQALKILARIKENNDCLLEVSIK